MDWEEAAKIATRIREGTRSKCGCDSPYRYVDTLVANFGRLASKFQLADLSVAWLDRGCAGLPKVYFAMKSRQG